jgi:hypothetical protein
MPTITSQVAGRRRRATSSPRRAELTISVPEAGRRYFSMSRNASYAAARRGEIPTVDIGRLKRVPVRLMEQMLDEAGSK